MFPHPCAPPISDWWPPDSPAACCDRIAAVADTDPRSCAVHQPNFFPRLTTVAKLFQADVWVVLDDVQFNARDYQHRARLAPLGDPAVQRWLTVPVHRPRGRESRIRELLLADPGGSRRRVSRLVHQYYRQGPYWASTRDAVEEVLAALELTDRVADVAEVSTRAVLARLGWRGEVVRSSELHAGDERSARLADLTRAVRAGTYLCGRGGARYLDEAPFAARGLTVRYPPPPELTGKDGMRTLSSLWALSVLGPDGLREEINSAVTV
ncbi:WbqC family protein [Amycolatopsis alkalitolerans]|uniref:WbqC family protein n=1 Tax=Amycolatopsis alkalitolerans TaxID=2547244 RepID=A0A5C4LW87_9PSEU|nr:WbqC family protein [Amycolatopsis alkalitolerans]TNC22211.1 WbqC family protein [Amycolatopsis alkalitolerans]